MLCIYCPDTDACYHDRPEDFGHSVTLRVAPAKSAQLAGVADASGFHLLLQE